LIVRRQQAVAEILEAVQAGYAPLCLLPKALSRLPDVERGITRALYGSASPAEFVGTVRALQQFRTDLGLPPLPDPPQDEPLPYDDDDGDDHDEDPHDAVLQRQQPLHPYDNGLYDNNPSGAATTATATAATPAAAAPVLASFHSCVHAPLLRGLLRCVAGAGLAGALARCVAPLDVRAAAANDFGGMFADKE
ncbi:hypothetical protein Agub_g6641, partial [Astrephomene gubernaculifera]